MPFPWLTVGMTALSVGSSIFGSIGKNRGVDARNRERKKQNQLDLDNANLAYNYTEIQSDVQYAWDLAKNSALRYTEAQKKLDFEFLQSNQINTAIANLKLNTQALSDTYITGEKLRADQESMNLGLATSRNIQQVGQQDVRAEEISQQSQLNKIQSQTEIANYMLNIERNANAQDQIMMQQDQQINELLGSIASDVMLEKFEQDLTMVASMVDEGQISARSNVRLGGTSTSKQLAMNQAKALGRSYGEMKVRQQQRNNRIQQQNLVNEQNGLRMFESALSSASLANSAEAVSKTADARQAQLGNQYKGVQLDRAQTIAEQEYTENVFERLTVPGFDLANRQGKREIEALTLSTQNELDTVGVPYRDPIIFDPQRALPGLRPTNRAPTLETKESLGASISNAVIAGANGALSAATTKGNGQLLFR